MKTLSVEEVVFRYGRKGGEGITALKGISLAIEKGEILGILGPNGSGKSTLLKVMSGAGKPDEGSVLLEGRHFSSYPRRELARRIAFVPQNLFLDFPFTCREVVLMGRFPYLGGLGLEREEDHRIAGETMRLTHTDHLAERAITDLSGGEQQRVILAQALAQQGDILMLDEPTSHLDIKFQLEILDLLKTLNRDRAYTIVLVLHDLNLAALYCDRIALLKEGLLHGLGSPSEQITEEAVREVYGARVRVERNPETGLPSVVPVPAHLSPGAGRERTFS